MTKINQHNLTLNTTHANQATYINDPTYWHIMKLDDTCDNQIDK
jgi:hypothetical protein